MGLKQRVQELKEQLPKEHKDVAHYVEHALSAIDSFEEHHRILAATQAVAGARINGEEERVFYETLGDIRLQLVRTLEQTIEDFLHKGDKHWTKNFKDGVD